MKFRVRFVTCVSTALVVLFRNFHTNFGNFHSVSNKFMLVVKAGTMVNVVPAVEEGKAQVCGADLGRARPFPSILDWAAFENTTRGLFCLSLS